MENINLKNGMKSQLVCMERHNLELHIHQLYSIIEKNKN